MIEFTKGDIFDTNTVALVNPVNCFGVMGRGLALQFKRIFPRNYEAYRNACNVGKIRSGKVFVFTTGWQGNPKFIFNFPTKNHWRDNSRIEDIEAGLWDLVQVVKKNRVRSIAIPPLGCGLGGLSWTEVYPLIEHAFAEVPSVQVILFAPKE